MSLPEKILWSRLKGDQLGERFRRQYQLDQYIVDFYCPRLKLAVEVDGKVHALHEVRNQVRESHLESGGVTTLRLKADTVFQHPDSAISMIENQIAELRG